MLMGLFNKILAVKVFYGNNNERMNVDFIICKVALQKKLKTDGYQFEFTDSKKSTYINSEMEWYLPENTVIMQNQKEMMTKGLTKIKIDQFSFETKMNDMRCISKNINKALPFAVTTKEKNTFTINNGKLLATNPEISKIFSYGNDKEFDELQKEMKKVESRTFEDYFFITTNMFMSFISDTKEKEMYLFTFLLKGDGSKVTFLDELNLSTVDYNARIISERVYASQLESNTVNLEEIDKMVRKKEFQKALNELSLKKHDVMSVVYDEKIAYINEKLDEFNRDIQERIDFVKNASAQNNFESGILMKISSYSTYVHNIMDNNNRYGQRNVNKKDNRFTTEQTTLMKKLIDVCLAYLKNYNSQNKKSVATESGTEDTSKTNVTAEIDESDNKNEPDSSINTQTSHSYDNFHSNKLKIKQKRFRTSPYNRRSSKGSDDKNKDERELMEELREIARTNNSKTAVNNFEPKINQEINEKQALPRNKDHKNDEPRTKRGPKRMGINDLRFEKLGKQINLGDEEQNKPENEKAEIEKNVKEREEEKLRKEQPENSKREQEEVTRREQEEKLRREKQEKARKEKERREREEAERKQQEEIARKENERKERAQKEKELKEKQEKELKEKQERENILKKQEEEIARREEEEKLRRKQELQEQAERERLEREEMKRNQQKENAQKNLKELVRKQQEEIARREQEKKLQREKQEKEFKEQQEKELKEKQEKEFKEQQEKELKEKQERELKEKQERELKEKQDKELKEQQDKELKEKQQEENKSTVQEEKDKHIDSDSTEGIEMDGTVVATHHKPEKKSMSTLVKTIIIVVSVVMGLGIIVGIATYIMDRRNKPTMDLEFYLQTHE